MDTVNLKLPELYINRELSQLEFNRRVLAQAENDEYPILERLKFLSITSTNMDEFFEIRVAGLKQQVELGSTQAGIDNRSPQETLKEIASITRELVASQYRILYEQLIPGMAAEGINFVRRSDWTNEQDAWLKQYFEDEVLPLLTPMGLDPAHPFPRILNKSLSFIVSLKGKDAFGRNSGMAVVQAPRSLPRLIQLPNSEPASGHQFVFLSSVIHAYVDSLFPGMEVIGCYQFRVTRNSDLYVDAEEVEDLLRALEGELISRRYGDAVRLEADHDCPEPMISFLLKHFGLTQDDLYLVNGPVNLHRLFAVYDMVDRSDLKFGGFTPSVPSALTSSKDFFESIGKRDILVHHPFESFAPVVDFLRQAAADPNVVAIKQTLYRTGPESAIVDQLVTAARAGKAVTVVVELRARFDEEANIALANRLQAAGAHVVYGVVGYKTHAKMLLILRREGKQLRNYVHLGTGNYHSRTARLYTDYGLFTCNPEIGQDIQKVFLQLTSLGKVPKPRKILQSPFTLHAGLIEKIEREAANAEAGKPARIIAKINSLIEPTLIQTLYQASNAGVQIDLIVRSLCGLRPGIPGVSENIRVRSIVGRFLEHTRAFYFENGGKSEVYCGSADWMGRNLFQRVEVCFPVEREELKSRVIEDLNCYLKDNCQAWILQRDGSYVRMQPAEGEEPYRVQSHLLAQLAS